MERVATVILEAVTGKMESLPAGGSCITQIESALNHKEIANACHTRSPSLPYSTHTRGLRQRVPMWYGIVGGPKQSVSLHILIAPGTLFWWGKLTKMWTNWISKQRVHFCLSKNIFEQRNATSFPICAHRTKCPKPHSINRKCSPSRDWSHFWSWFILFTPWLSHNNVSFG